MIRFRRLFEFESALAQAKLNAIESLFRKVFPSETGAVERLFTLLGEPTEASGEAILLYAENGDGEIVGFSLTLYFADLRLAYLYYIASDPECRARGIGGALYEAVREHLLAKGAKGLLLDVGPDDAKLLKDPALLPINRRRITFYARYGAHPVAGTQYEQLPNPRNDGYRTLLLYDPLGRAADFPKREARRFVARMFRAQYGYPENDPYVRAIVGSFQDDPVCLRRLPVAKPAAGEKSRWIQPIKVVVAARHEIHHIREKGYVERPVRVRAVLRGLEDQPIAQYPVRRFGIEPIEAVHDPKLVGFLRALCEQLDTKTLLYPEVFPIRRPERRPRELISRMGYYCMDTFTPLTRNVYRAARASVDCALTAADLLLAGERYVYALCRPPGHHAERAVFGGFCYFNNAAIAAQHLVANGKGGKVAILDIDYHHGNGSQEIFYRRNDVLVTSIHGSPAYAYPHFAGYDDERGEGEGLGFNRNYPLRRGVEDTQYLGVLGEALQYIRRFKPDWLVLSLGFDIMRGDPTGSFLLTQRGMRQIGEKIGRLGVPTLVVQEGGYTLSNLRYGARAFFQGLGATWY